MFYSNGYSVLRIVVVGPCAYVLLVLLLRASGKRTLSKFNAFDLIVTISLGSTLASVLLTKDVALVDGVVAFLVLVGMQFAATWLSVRSPTISRAIKSDPRLLYYHGAFLDRALRQERVTRGEVEAAVRKQGVASMESVRAVVIETTGVISVLQTGQESERSLDGVEGYAPDTATQES